MTQDFKGCKENHSPVSITRNFKRCDINDLGKIDPEEKKEISGENSLSVNAAAEKVVSEPIKQIERREFLRNFIPFLK